jgi:hypothetical protein
MRILILLAASAISLAPASRCAAETPREGVQPPVLRVGAGRELKRPSAAAQVARDGNIIEIDAGVYNGDAAVWRQSQLTIRAVGGRVQLRADGANAEGKAIWVVKGNETTIEGVEFSGAKVPAQNGAGVRLEGAGLTVRNCYFHDNENGILAAAGRTSDVVIEHSEFAHNGFGDGYSHNIYIGNVRSFTLRFSYVHHALVGHNVKSRALQSTIISNRLMDENDGKSSYVLEFPDGGLAFVIGNVLQHGPEAENATVVSYGAEGVKQPLNQLYFINNTVVNDLHAGGRFLFVKSGASRVRVENNIFSGAGEVLSGPGELRNNVIAARTDFVDPEDFDYRVKPGAAAMGRGVDPETARGVAHRTPPENASKARTRARTESGKPEAVAPQHESR